MDDWASPWAEEDQYQHPINETKKEIKGTSVTTHPAKPATLTLGEGINSPWDNEEEDDDDDGFGEWSVPPDVKVAEGGGFQLDEGWHRNAGDQGELGDHVKDLAPVWKENITLSDPPKLAPSPMPKHLMRQHSPDPWATEISRNDIPHRDEEGSSEEGSVELEKAVHDPRDVTLFEQSPTPGFQESTQEPSPRVDAPAAESLQSTESKRNSTAEVDRSSSQPSSSPSVTSQHEDGRHESPRTSMDDDTSRPQVSRKVSAKVQELTEHFDGLVKQDGESGVANGDSLQVRNREQGSREGTDDFADFENTTLDAKDMPEENIPTSDPPNNLKHIVSSVTEASTSKTPVTSKDVTSPIQPSHKIYGPVDVDIDFSILDELFPLEKSKPAEDIFIPDTIPHDSFCSTEERKMWYRISRYGPMLKHNSGDDENYVRVSWLKSTVRDDTLKIVARWMEEDRLSGHVVLGGGGKTSTLFGWGDSKAPVVSLASAFPSKDIKKTPKPFANQPATSDIINPTSPLYPSRQIPEKTQSTPEIVKPIPSPVVNFGWNSVPENVPNGSIQMSSSSGLAAKMLPVSTSASILSTRSPTSSLRPIVLPKTTVSIESPQQTPVPVSASLSEVSTDLLVPVARTADGDEEDKEDEWGDMVSTPNTTTFEIVPFPKDKSREDSKITQILPDAPPRTLKNQIIESKQSSIREPVDRSPLGPTAIPPFALAGQQTATHPLTSTTGDPWASAEFSFFNSSSAPLPISTRTPSLAPTPLPTILKLTPPKSVTFTSLPPRTLQPPKPAQSQIPPSRTTAPKPNPTTNEEVKQEELVQSIIKGLPDLSYMLRR